MGRTQSCDYVLLAMILALVCISVKTVSAKDDFVHCQNTVRSWAASSRDGEFKESKHTLRDLLFFLHVPRTGGRTYFYCFLKKLYTSYLECPRSYDKLRFDPSKSDCKLMSTHDDYSMMSKLPKERTSVVTIIRNPVDRVFSTYEFAVEVAARFLVHPNLTSATKMSRKILKGNNGVSTLDIWPWKYMVPWMREDLFARRNARNHGDFADIKQSNDSYNMEEVVMPLHEFINDPVTQDIVHNGATFQVAGLTNNSCIAESHEVRHCVRKYYTLGEYVLEVAKRRLDDMLYVGLTEDHKESATMFANVVGLQLLSQLQALSSRIEQAAKNKTELSSSFPDSEHDTDHLLNSTTNQTGGEQANTTKETMSVEKLIKDYEVCSSTLRESQALRRTSSLKRISPANFSKEARLQVPDTVLQRIISLNSLDVELYKHAQHIFAEQKGRFTQKLVETEKQNVEKFIASYSFLLGTTFVLLIFLFVNLRIRSLKLKL